MQNEELVSVLMPVKNCGPFLKPAVDSILQQTHENLELIIIDDYSDDGSLLTITKDSRIRVIQRNQPGIVSALNLGFEHASGQYIARMDGDDISVKSRLNTQVTWSKKHPEIGIIGSLVEIFSDFKQIQSGNLNYQQWLNSVQSQNDFNINIFVESPLVHPSVLIRREVFQQLGGYRDMSWAEDYDFWLRAHQLGIGIAKVPEILIRWREHEHRLTHTDNRYSTKEFFNAKAWAMSIGVLKNKQAVICGTGKQAMMLCDSLLDQGVEVDYFIDIDPKKIGKTRRQREIKNIKALESISDDTLILGALGTHGARNKLRQLLTSFNLSEPYDFLMAC